MDPSSTRLWTAYQEIAQAVSENPFIATLIQKLEDQIMHKLHFTPSPSVALDKSCIQEYMDRYIPVFTSHLIWSAVMFGDASVGFGKVKVENSKGHKTTIRVPIVYPFWSTGYHQDEVEAISDEEPTVYTFEPKWTTSVVSSMGRRMSILHALYTHMIDSSMVACQSASVPTAIITKEQYDPKVYTNLRERAIGLNRGGHLEHARDAVLSQDDRAYHEFHMQLSDLGDEIYQANKEKQRAILNPYSRVGMDGKADDAESKLLRTYTIPLEGMKVTPLHNTGKVEQFDHFLPAMRSAMSVACGFTPEEKRDKSTKLQISDQSPDEPSVFMNKLVRYVNDVIKRCTRQMFKYTVRRQDKPPKFFYEPIPHLSSDELLKFTRDEMKMVTTPAPAKK